MGFLQPLPAGSWTPHAEYNSGAICVQEHYVAVSVSTASHNSLTKSLFKLIMELVGALCEGSLCRERLHDLF
jgi:hypothetical protein